MDTQEARKVLEEEMGRARQACWAEVLEALNKHGFRINISTVLTSDSKILHQIDLVPIETDNTIKVMEE